MKQLIVSLVSDQTIPNVQIIKEFRTDNTDYLFVVTASMQRKGVVAWITKSAKISSFQSVVVNEYSIADITKQLTSCDYSQYDRLIVNITGGTKIMTLSVYNSFKNRNEAEIYYVTGLGNTFLDLKNGTTKNFSHTISLEEYLTAYGFSIRKSQPSGVPFVQTQKIYQKYVSGVFNAHPAELNFLRAKRNKTIGNADFSKVSALLVDIDYVPLTQNELSASETKYLTGEWFEEYIGESIKKELSISDGDILIGTTIRKNIPSKTEFNPISVLVGLNLEQDKQQDTANEIDVMFIKDNKFHVIECKTSIIDTRIVYKEKRTEKGKLILDTNGNPINEAAVKDNNILGETIYKSDALKAKFGLYAKSYIFTLTDFQNYIKQNPNSLNAFVSVLKRASISNIKIADRRLLDCQTQISDLL